MAIGLYDNYNHIWIETHDVGSVASRVTIFFRAIVSLLAIVGQRPILHIHAASYGSFFRKAILTGIGKLFGCKVILHLHASEFRVFYEGANALTRKMVKATFSLADVVIVLSQSWKKYVSAISHDANIVVINNFVPAVGIDSRYRDDSIFTMLFMGKLGQRKGAYDLVDAMEKIAMSLPNCRVLFCGDGEIDTVSRRIEEAGLSGICKVVGWIGVDEKAEYYSKSHVFLLPSYNEGLPMSVLEAMSGGLAIITTPVGGIPEVIVNGENGLLVEPGDTAGLANAIRTLHGDPELRLNLGETALHCYKQSYCPEVILPQLEAIYRGLDVGRAAQGCR